MNFSLRRLEIIVVFVVFVALCGLVALPFVVPKGAWQGIPTLLPYPNVTNEKEALMESLRAGSSASVSEQEKLDIMRDLKAAPGSAQVSASEKMRIMESLGAH